MADFILTKGLSNYVPSRLSELYDNNIFHPTKELTIYGKAKTYTHFSEEDEFITLIGHSYYARKPLHQCLSEILTSFKESQIRDLKCNLVGQFILIIKKRESAYVFADCMQARNVFYSLDGSVVSSAYSAMESVLETSGNDLNSYKIFEYMAMRHTLYTGWLGRTTMHKRIMRLRPYEYMVINASDFTYRIGTVTYEIDNKKESDIESLSSTLVACLKALIEQPDFKDEKVGVTLTGGYDSRLLACIAAQYFNNISFRIAVSSNDPKSMFDLRVARKIAEVVGIPLDVYWASGKPDRKRFYKLTDGFAPSENAIITRLIDDSGSYAMGMGGCYGTELFAPLPYDSIGEFVDKAIDRAKTWLYVENSMWKQFRECMAKEFDDIKQHYSFAVPNERDEIRIFNLVNTAWFSSFILSSYNINGAHMEPYGSWPIIEIAFKVSERHIGRRTNLAGTCLVQKMAMSKESYNIGGIMTSHYCPMLPLSIRTSPPYLRGYLRHILYSLNARILMGRRRHIETTHFTGGRYISDGWNSPFVHRIKEYYGDYVRMENV